MKQIRCGSTLTGISRFLKIFSCSRVRLFGITLSIVFAIALLLSPGVTALAQEDVPAIYLTPTYQEIPNGDNPYGELRVMMDAKSESVVFARVAIVFNPSEVQIASEVDISHSPLGHSVGVRKAERANKTGRLIIILASSGGEGPVSGLFELARFQIQPSGRAGEAELLFDEEDMQIVSPDFLELPITTEGAIVNVTSLNYYFPYVYNTVPSYEINDSFEQAFGPLVPNLSYLSTVGRGDEDDYYYFDVNILAPIKMSFVDTEKFEPNPDDDFENPKVIFYDEKMNMVETFRFQDFTFLPVATGRYYIRINYCCHFNPEKWEYRFKIDYNGTSIPLTSAAYIISEGNPVANARYNYNDTETGYGYESITDSSGKYYIPEARGICYYLSYGEYYPQSILGTDYSRKASHWYCTDVPKDFDISPVNLLEPYSPSEPLELPITFKWKIRENYPKEKYEIHIIRRLSYYEVKDRIINVGHAGEYTLEKLFAGEGLYKWYVVAKAGTSSAKRESFSYEVYLTDDVGGQIQVIPMVDLEVKKSEPR